MAFYDIKAAAGRFDGVTRPYTEQDVARLRGSVKIEQTLAQRGAEKLWELLKSEPYVHALGALSGNQVGAGWLGWLGDPGFGRARERVRTAARACARSSH